MTFPWAELGVWIVPVLAYFATVYGAGFACGYLVGLWKAFVEPDNRSDT